MIFKCPSAPLQTPFKRWVNGSHCQPWTFEVKPYRLTAVCFFRFILFFSVFLRWDGDGSHGFHCRIIGLFWLMLVLVVMGWRARVIG